MGKPFNIIDLEEISTNRKDEVVEVLRLPFNRFPGAAGHIKDEIVNEKKMERSVERLVCDFKF
ncbi:MULTISPECIES: hypothetical protein [Bacillus]|nr:hypothetical protein [Bacillus cereus]KXZ04633.1 hypothetical protein AT281_08135 [Bacillus cereus]PET56773.1 hypothetical protein CN536_23825 [Bacillus cereus]PFA39150.1 hypothetical protein CN381_28315 [Bacillus cereus]HDR8031513.1 hypothetical protein [Bacillus cereus]HDR8123236.1 hypothetical protein [Bacillus cereus]